MAVGPRRVRLDVSYGGQAVIEGVMMRGPRRIAVAVRSPDQQVIVRKEEFLSWGERLPFLRLPFLRGVVSLIESLKIGLDALTFSANAAAPEEEQMTPGQMTGTLFFSAAVAIIFFVVLPTLAVDYLKLAGLNPFMLNLSEGLLRIMILLGYIWSISLMPDIRRVLEYHGAEHKVINAYEAGEALTVDNARAQSRFHPRCGTSFLLFVAIVAILLFVLFGWPSFWERLLIRLALLPVVAGVAYEFIRLSGRSNAAWLKPFILPGIWLQSLTTREPDDDQLEVAIRALKETMQENAGTA